MKRFPTIMGQTKFQMTIPIKKLEDTTKLFITSEKQFEQLLFWNRNNLKKFQKEQSLRFYFNNPKIYEKLDNISNSIIESAKIFKQLQTEN